MAKPLTPMQAAVRTGSLEAVSSLLQKGADPREGAPLLLACGNLSYEIAQLLLEHGADPNVGIPGDYPELPLLRCCYYEDKSKERIALARLLLSRGADPSLSPKGHDGALHFAAMRRHTKMVKLLLEAGAAVNAPGISGNTPLHHAASSGAIEAAKVLLAAGAEVDALNDAKDPPIFMAINGYPPSAAMVALLLDHGVGLKVVSGYKKSLLSAAAFGGANDIIELLLERGAAIDDDPEDAAIIVALKRKKLETVRLLWARGASPETKDLLKYSVMFGDMALIRGVVQKRQHKDPNALLEAAEKGDLKLIKLLLDAGIPVDGVGGWSGETALFKACYSGKLEAARLLLQRGANLEARDNRGNTPLLHAAWNQHTPTIMLLLEWGADVNATNKLNWSALMQACARGNEALARLFIERGAALDLIDQERGYTALTIAKVRYAASLVTLLEQHGATERALRRPPEGERLSILDCDICAYLPHKKDLARETSAEEIPYLETIKDERLEIDRYATSRSMLKQCPICGTYYEHTHSVDTEDDFAKGGPTINEALARCNLLCLQDLLDEARRGELSARYPALIASFVAHIQQGAETAPNLLPYLVTSITDDYLRIDSMSDLDTLLLRSPRAEVSLCAAERLLDLHAEHKHTRPATKEIAEKARAWVHDNKALLEARVRAWEGITDDRLAVRLRQLLSVARYYHLLSAG